MIRTHRQSEMLTFIRSRGRVLVDELVELYQITPQSVRKDLQALANDHEIVRFHGGASLLAGVEYISFEARKNIAAEAKTAIAEQVAIRIPDHTTVMINAGTTTAVVARALKSHAGLRIVTDNIVIANDLRIIPGIEVMVPGGVVRPSDGAILGEEAVAFIRQFRSDFAIISVSAIASDGTLLDYDLREAHVARAIIDNSRHIILAADSSKFDQSAPIKIAHLSQMHTLVTDRCKMQNIVKLCAENDVEILESMLD